MPIVLLVLAGLCSAFLSLTFLVPFSYFAVIILYCTCLYFYFFSKATIMPYLAGLSVGLELFGTQHFGIGGLLGLLTWGLYYSFAELVQFIDIYPRYISAALTFVIIAALLFFGGRLFLLNLPALLLTLGIITLASALARHSTRHNPHELA